MTEVIEIHPVFWKVQLWLDDRLIEEHIAPPELAEQYANVIRLRIRNLPGRRLRCEPVSEYEPAYPRDDHRMTAAASRANLVRRRMESDDPAL